MSRKKEKRRRWREKQILGALEGRTARDNASVWEGTGPCASFRLVSVSVPESGSALGASELNLQPPQRQGSLGRSPGSLVSVPDADLAWTSRCTSGCHLPGARSSEYLPTVMRGRRRFTPSVPGCRGRTERACYQGEAFLSTLTISKLEYWFGGLLFRSRGVGLQPSYEVLLPPAGSLREHRYPVNSSACPFAPFSPITLSHLVPHFTYSKTPL